MAGGPFLRFGIVGLGFAAVSTVPAILRHPRLSIVAAADTDPLALERFRARFDIPGAYGQIEELCANPTVDAVYIATPTTLHAEQAILAAEHGKHLIVEKPLAVSLAEADRLIAAVERHGVQLVVGHSQSFEPPVLAMRALVRGGELGRVLMISSWCFTDWLYRPRRPDELNESVGGGVVYRQGAHQLDIIRLVGGGLVRSVRATTGVWDRERPGIGSYTAYLEFEDGAAATAVYSGYDGFQTTELTGIDEAGEPVQAVRAGESRRAVREAGPAADEVALKRARGFAGASLESTPALEARPDRGESSAGTAPPTRHQAHFGLTVVSCERGDIRQSPDGLLVYDERGRRELPLPPDIDGRDLLVQELYDAVALGVRPLHDGRWAKATLEVSLAIMASARERREILLEHQVPLAD